jgi:hypothetical protein
VGGCGWWGPRCSLYLPVKGVNVTSEGAAVPVYPQPPYGLDPPSLASATAGWSDEAHGTVTHLSASSVKVLVDTDSTGCVACRHAAQDTRALLLQSSTHTVTRAGQENHDTRRYTTPPTAAEQSNNSDPGHKATGRLPLCMTPSQLAGSSMRVFFDIAVFLEFIFPK